jgi:hypothetical protein
MNKKNVAFKSKSSLAVLIIILIAYSVITIFTNHYTRLTADSMLYFSLAQKYLNGDLSNAINGYWGPLLAWLLVPFLYFGKSDVFAINALNLIVGILTIFGVWMLSYRFEMSEKIRSAIVVALLPIIVSYSLVQPMDFLLLCILVYYLNIVLSARYSSLAFNGISCGVLGALAYFTKAYAFPFFITHFLIINILHYFNSKEKPERKGVLRNAVAGFVLFILLSGSWIMAISDKYGEYTFSTMRRTNFNAPGPDVAGTGREFGVPVFYKGFYPPPNETAFVVWEDPSYLKGDKWSAWDSPRHFKHFIKLLIRNLADGLLIFESFSTFSIFIVSAYLLLLCLPKDKILSRWQVLYPFFTIVLFTGGYALFHFEHRYLWLANILVLLMGGHLLHLFFQKDFFKGNLRKNILLTIVLISFIFIPSRYVLQASKGNMDKDMYYMSTDLKQYNIQGNIASNREYSGHDAWHKTFRLAYWLNSRYYGQAGENTDKEELQSELKKYNIDYYFIWGEPDNTPDFLSHNKEITNGEIPGLRIYSLKEIQR